MKISVHMLFVMLTLLIGGGMVFAWHAFGLQLFAYHAAINSVAVTWGNSTPPIHPVFTPCFLGSVAFVVAFVWALVTTIQTKMQTTHNVWWLRAFLIFGTCFALAVIGYEALEYYNIIHLGTSFSCAPGVPPLQTPCFIGFLFYLVAALGAHTILRRLKI